MTDTSKEAVKFFEPDCYAGNAFMEEDPQGCWVGIDDYDALRAELDEAKADRDQLVGIVELLLEPDTNICCDGMGCGCRGAGTHKYATYLFAGMKLKAVHKGENPND